VPVLFAVTMFVSAALLMMVQPMIGRLVLPLVGGSPAAWNTCMVFFQALLLAGYAYAHWLTSTFPARKQIIIHLAVIAAALAVLGMSVAFSPSHTPIAVVESLAPQGSQYPMFGMLALLVVAVGIPFFVVSTSAPLLTRWFAVTGHASARDPYFLYAASNAGSLISLLGYPLFIEPSLTLAHQQWLWATGFIVLFAMTFLCGRQSMYPMPVVGHVTTIAAGPPPSRARKFKWVALAFVPSSLMLGVTFHMTTDITSMPLLWVPPLALYLLTFIIAFARLPRWFRPLIGNIAPVCLLLLIFVLCTASEIGGTDSSRAFLWLGLHVLIFFVVALMCHTEIAYDRPEPKYLTSFFLWMSFGGMLGGVFNGLVAPLLFPNSWEYPIALAVAAFLVPKFIDDSKDTPDAVGRARMFDIIIPLIMLLVVATLSMLVMWCYQNARDLNSFQNACVKSLSWLGSMMSDGIRAMNFAGKIKSITVAAFIAYALPCMATFFFIDRPLRFGLCAAAILFVGIFRDETSSSKQVIAKVRSYFGILKASSYDLRNEERSAIFYEKADIPAPGEKKLTFVDLQVEPHLQLVHGTTLHGRQAASHWTYPIRDEFPLIGNASPWSPLLTAGSMMSFDTRQEPLTYYHRTGPVGAVFYETYGRFEKPNVAMVGLGTGSVAAYARPNLPFTFYEIDPAVLAIVDKPLPANRKDAELQFTYLADARARGAKIEMILGDGRLKLKAHAERITSDPSQKYSLLLVDAFSSDSIPLHLLTVQAVQLYMNCLEDHGLLALHISNKFVDLEPVVAAIAKELNLSVQRFSDRSEVYSGKTSSDWCVLARTNDDLGTLGLSTLDHGETPLTLALYGGVGWQTIEPKWRPAKYNEKVSAWTDDYADVMRVMTMKEVIAIRRFFGMPSHFQRDDDE
jgi:hypothetical protein